MSLIVGIQIKKFAPQTKLRMIHEIALETYPRKEQFNFFKDFEEPFFGITTSINFYRAYRFCKTHNLPFFAYYLHATNKAVNETSNFRQRIRNNAPATYEVTHVSTTMARPNHTFGFSYIEHHPNFECFLERFIKEKKRIQETDQLMPDTMTDQVTHYSALPWLNFSSVAHARKFSINDTCPKITFGKIHHDQGEWMLPISVHAHHALVDGYHVGQLIACLTDLLQEHEPLSA